MSFLEPCHWMDWHFGGDYDCGDLSDNYSTYKHQKYESPQCKIDEEFGPEEFVPDELHYFDHFKDKLINFGLASDKDKLEIKTETEKAQLFAINGAPLFWVPKKLTKERFKTFFINKCFDIKKALTYQG